MEFTVKNMFNLDEEKIDFEIGKKALVLWQFKESENVIFFYF